MLQRPQILPFLRETGGRLEVEFLSDPGDGRVLHFLDRLLRLLRRIEGAPLRTVQEALSRQERRVRDARRLEGISRTLMGLARFEAPPGTEQAAEFRRALFAARGERWPPIPGDEDAPYQDAAQLLDLPAHLRRDLRALTYADHPGERVLRRAPRLDAPALLDRYNLELARGTLLDAETLTLGARGGWKDLVRAVKLARVMYRMSPDGDPAQGRRRAYRMELTGPAAPFLAHPRRYGIRFAQVVPALTRAPSWWLEAGIRRQGRRVPYRLEAGAPVGKGRRARYDSRWEAELARDLRGTQLARSEWSLFREEAPISLGDELLLPDFTLRHRDGREALVELMGFWTPEYLETKLRKVRAAGLPNLVLVVFRGLAAGEGEAAVEGAGAEVVWFSGKARAREVLEAAERVAVR
jgi:predicted nuclease of restriction endonuclease-like RecB superfamily